MKNFLWKFIYIIFVIILTDAISQNPLRAMSCTSNSTMTGQLVQSFELSNKDLETLFRKNLQTENPIIYNITPRGLIISIDGSEFFECGNCEIKEYSKKILDKIAELLKYIDKPCIIEGHIKYNAQNFPNRNSNLELSMIQVGKIMEYLIKTAKLNPQKIHSIGFGDMSPSKNTFNKEPDTYINFIILNQKD